MCLHGACWLVCSQDGGLEEWGPSGAVSRAAPPDFVVETSAPPPLLLPCLNLRKSSFCIYENSCRLSQDINGKLYMYIISIDKEREATKNRKLKLQSKEFTAAAAAATCNTATFHFLANLV